MIPLLETCGEQRTVEKNHLWMDTRYYWSTVKQNRSGFHPFCLNRKYHDTNIVREFPQCVCAKTPSPISQTLRNKIQKLSYITEIL